MEIRPANQTDSEDLLIWRNDPLSVSMSEFNQTVTHEQHANWIKLSLCNPNRAIFIGELKGLKIGVCRFDYVPQGKYSDTSINLNPIARSKGFSPTLLAECIKQYQLIYNGRPLKARIRKQNLASIRLFEKCNFILKDADENFYIYLLEN